MPYIVKQLVAGLGEPTTANPSDPIQAALDTMVRNGFSQLPVAKGEEYYFVTQESILTALHGFGMAPSEASLCVEDALTRAHRVFFETDDLFELLAGMRDTNAALVVDENAKLKHLVTTYDTTQFFRQWSEDILHARDIETSLKKIVNAAFKTSQGEIDEQLRNSSIAEITPSNKDLRRKFEKALKVYLDGLGTKEIVISTSHLDAGFGELIRRRSGTDVGSASSSTGDYAGFCDAATACLSSAIREHLVLDDQLTLAAFDQLYNRGEQIKPFEKLSLEQYVQLFLSEQCWDRCAAAFGVSKDAVSNLLMRVRKTRNRLAHFREEEINAQDRNQLKMCSQWLAEKAKNAILELEKTAHTATS